MTDRRRKEKEKKRERERERERKWEIGRVKRCRKREMRVGDN